MSKIPWALIERDSRRYTERERRERDREGGLEYRATHDQLKPVIHY